MIIQKIHKMNKKILKTSKKFMYYLFFALLSSTGTLQAFYEAFEEDVKDSKSTPLISGIDSTKILEKDQAAITVCTTSIKGILGAEYNHVYLVFEIRDAINPEEINLFSVHFGGDGHSSHVNEGHPIFDSREDTLIKVFRGKKVDYLGSSNKNNLKYKKIEPIYTPKAVFTVDKENALNALKIAENERDLQYSLSGDPFGIWGENTYNCVTYANKVLKDCGIDTQFDSCYVKNATNFITCCNDYEKKRIQTINKTNRDFCTKRPDENRSQKKAEYSIFAGPLLETQDTSYTWIELQDRKRSSADVSKNDDESSLRKENDGRLCLPQGASPMNQRNSETLQLFDSVFADFFNFFDF